MATDSLLLDTHAWIWLMQGIELKSEAVERLEAAAVSSALWVSAISIWEVATLAAKSRLNLAVPIDIWVQSALAQPGLRLLPLEPAISLESARLPGFHGDPADRILVASARLHQLQLVTRDQRILDWARTGRVRVLEV